LQVGLFNFAILCYSRKLDAREKLVFYSSRRTDRLTTITTVVSSFA